MAVITVDRALAEGSTPDQLLNIAEWHSDAAFDAERKMKARKKKPLPEQLARMASDNERHRHIARKLIKVADMLTFALRRAA